MSPNVCPVVALDRLGVLSATTAELPDDLYTFLIATKGFEAALEDLKNVSGDV